MKKVLIVAHTLDGFIAKSASDKIDWTSTEDKLQFALNTKKAGVIIMGETTFKNIKKPLKDRLNIVLTQHPKNFSKQAIEDTLEFYNLPPKQIIKELEQRNFETVFICGGSYTYTQFLKNKLIDEIWVTVEPLIFGSGLTTFNAKLFETKLELINSKKLNKNTIQLRYKINKK